MTPNFWRLLWHHRRNLFLQWDFALSLASAVLVALLVPCDQLSDTWIPYTSAAIGVSVALLGIAIAAQALVISVLPDDIFMFMSRQPRGLPDHAFPFGLAATLSALTSVAGLGAMLLVPSDAEVPLRMAAGLLWFLFLWTIASFLSLIRLTFDYWELKATYLQLSSAERDTSDGGSSSARGSDSIQPPTS